MPRILLAHTASLLIQTKNFFLAIRAVCAIVGVKNTAGAAVFAEILLITVAIPTVPNNILTVTFAATIDVSFGKHSGAIQKNEKSCSFNLLNTMYLYH